MESHPPPSVDSRSRRQVMGPDAFDVTGRDLTRRQLVDLIVSRLRFRWLGNPDVVSDCLEPFFGADEAGRENLVSELVVRCRQGQWWTSATLNDFLRTHHSIRRLYSKRKTVRVALAARPPVAGWPVAPIASLAELASLLSLPSPQTIDWLTLPHRRRETSVNHYRRHARRKRDGSYRWIESPRPTLARAQRAIKLHVIDPIPLHEAAHGFRRGRNILTAVGDHQSQAVVISIDLHNFFGSIDLRRVSRLMRVAGYSPAIAWAIACLCCAPPVPSRESIPGLPSSHLPQGACTSPGIANAIAFRLDRRLAGLSQSLGIRYTRYADDLLFSGDSSIAGRTERLATSVAAIALDEGFEVNYRKTRTMRRGNRQRALGLILNDRINTPRRDYETLKAILTNCVRHGPKSQNRAGHPRFRESLRGRISHIAGVHPGRGKKLSILFHQIDWA